MMPAMEVQPTPFAGLLVCKIRRHYDSRGFFCEVYNRKRFADLGLGVMFVQDNLSVSHAVGTLRGLHFQREPFSQAKLVTVARGAVRDVVMDLRRSSRTFGRHYTVELTAVDGQALYVPAGFAHGFLTLAPDTIFTYKISDYYSPQHEAGIRFDDPILGIDWG